MTEEELSCMNPELYAVLPPDKREEYKRLFPKPVQIRYPVCTPDGWIWYDMEYIIPEKEPIEKLLNIEEIKSYSLSDVKLLSSLPEFGSKYSMYNKRDVQRGRNWEEWLSGARPMYIL